MYLAIPVYIDNAGNEVPKPVASFTKYYIVDPENRPVLNEDKTVKQFLYEVEAQREVDKLNGKSLAYRVFPLQKTIDGKSDGTEIATIQMQTIYQVWNMETMETVFESDTEKEALDKRNELIFKDTK